MNTIFNESNDGHGRSTTLAYRLFGNLASSGARSEELTDLRDVNRWAAFYERYAPAVYRYFRRQVRDAHHAEDLTATTFEKALATSQRTTIRGSPVAWLFGIAHHTLHEHRRRHRRDCDAVDLDEVTATLADEADPPEERVLALERLRRLGQQIQRLPTDQRDALLLRYVAGLSVKEVAAALGRREGAAKMLLHRGLNSLKRCYANEED